MPGDGSKHSFILPSMVVSRPVFSMPPSTEDMRAVVLQPERVISSKKKRGLRLVTAYGKNVCFFCRRPGRHLNLCPTRMERVRSDYFMYMPAIPPVSPPMAPPSIPEPQPVAPLSIPEPQLVAPLSIPELQPVAPLIIHELVTAPSTPEPLTLSVATQTMTPETEETSVAAASAAVKYEMVYDSVRTKSEDHLFRYFVARCPPDDLNGMAAQWNALLCAWRAADCLEVRLPTGLITMTDVTFKTADHLMVHASAGRAIGPATNKTIENDAGVGISAIASASRFRKRRYLPCPHCGHKTRRHSKLLADTCELYQFYQQRSEATVWYSFENAIKDFALLHDSKPQASGASYIV